MYLDERQTHAVMPLASGLVPRGLAPKTWAVLEHTLAVRNGSHLDTGLTGTYFMTKLLLDAGRNDLVRAPDCAPSGTMLVAHQRTVLVVSSGAHPLLSG